MHGQVTVVLGCLVIDRMASAMVNSQLLDTFENKDSMAFVGTSMGGVRSLSVGGSDVAYGIMQGQPSFVQSQVMPFGPPQQTFQSQAMSLGSPQHTLLPVMNSPMISAMSFPQIAAQSISFQHSVSFPSAAKSSGVFGSSRRDGLLDGNNGSGSKDMLHLLHLLHLSNGSLFGASGGTSTTTTNNNLLTIILLLSIL